MIRLTGLPSPVRAPRATVERTDDGLSLRFFDPVAQVTRFDVPAYTLGDDADLEAEQLRLLARLQAMGYAAQAAQPDA